MPLFCEISMIKAFYIRHLFVCFRLMNLNFNLFACQNARNVKKAAMHFHQTKVNTTEIHFN